MTEADEIERLKRLLDDLQSQLAFQEQALADLSDTLARQDRDIARLQREWTLVQERYASLQAQLPESDIEKPPHY